MTERSTDSELNARPPEAGSPSQGESLPRRGCLLGIDYGTKRVGVSVSDVFQKLASPLHNYQRVSRTADEEFFRRLAAEYKVAGFVVGLPLHMNGDESQLSLEARTYGAWLQAITKLPITFQDERLTSAQAELLLQAGNFTETQRKARIDKLAAHVLLQDWLNLRQNQAKIES